MSTSFHIRGDVAVPGDKSISHRALLFSAISTGESRLRGVLPAGDPQSTARVLRELGCPVPDVPVDGGEIRVRSSGLDAWKSPSEALDCGNSGTTARLLLGLLAGRAICATLTGDDSLRSRPMRRVTAPLAQMGAQFRELGRPDRLPLEVTGGRLRPLEFRSEVASAQVKSAILLAGISGGVPVAVEEPLRSRDHSERLLGALGVALRTEHKGDGWVVRLDPPSGPLPPVDLEVPGDFSSAAFLIGLALLADSGDLRIRGVGVNPTRTGLLDVVRRMGGRVDLHDPRDQGGEPVADLIAASPGRLRGTEIGSAEIPGLIDELPLIAVLAARAEGETHVTGAMELRVKESDRIAAVVRGLRAIGADAEELPDGFVVRGTDQPLRGRIETETDHRIAMAFGVLGAQPGNEIIVDDPGAAEVSFPGFWELIAGLTAS